jgi:hypothetical protein
MGLTLCTYNSESDATNIESEVTKIKPVPTHRPFVGWWGFRVAPDQPFYVPEDVLGYVPNCRRCGLPVNYAPNLPDENPLAVTQCIHIV